MKSLSHFFSSPLKESTQKAAIALLLAAFFITPVWAADAEKTGASSAAIKNPDPWESFNRAIYSFNDAADSYVLRPVAKGYRAITPSVVRTGVSNFFGNLGSPAVIINSALQGKIKQAGSSTARFVVNSTVGVAGLFDVAVRWNMPAHNEDFGQTLAVWGVGAGPYVVLPFMGPSTVRDAGSFAVDSLANPRSYLLDWEPDLALTVLSVINFRAQLLDVDTIVQGDRYLFMRDLFLQRREFAIKDGQVDDAFLDDAESADDETETETETDATGNEADENKATEGEITDSNPSVSHATSSPVEGSNTSTEAAESAAPAEDDL